ncbi:MAG: UDP-N-acetylmuramate--L-alanine ligase [Mycobacteriales bacterium]
MLVETTNDLTGVTAEDLGRVHVIGIGGVGMNGLARLLVTRGIPVSGSDVREWPPLEALRALGAKVYIGHSEQALDDVDTVVYSTAIPESNIELAEARRRGLRTLHRAEALVTAMTDRHVIAVAGTNGKTTTTAMVTTILQRTGNDPSFVIGGELAEVGASAHYGTGRHFVIEADESDKTFLLYHPDITIVTNVEEDHMDTYGDLAGVEAGFAEFADRITLGGALIACADDPGAMRLAEYARGIGVTVSTYGVSDGADLRLANLTSDNTSGSYTVMLDGEPVGEVRIDVPGRHMALNSAAALLAVARIGLPVAEAVAALREYRGVRRRFELKGVARGVRVYDDYAYHPSSMMTQLRTVRGVADQGRLIVVFQPYRLYRTNAFLSEIAAALRLADEVVVMEVYCPGEERGPGEGGAALMREIVASAHADGQEITASFEPSWSAVPGLVAERARSGDLVLTMGAPPIVMMGDEILAACAKADSDE